MYTFLAIVIALILLYLLAKIALGRVRPGHEDADGFHYDDEDEWQNHVH